MAAGLPVATGLRACQGVRSTPAARGNSPPSAATEGRRHSSMLGATSARDLARTIAELRRAQRALAARPRDDTLAVLGDVVDDWLAPDSLWFARAVRLLPEATGFSPAMVRHALPTLLEPLRGPSLAQLLTDEVGPRRGPPLICHVLPGNLPGLAAIPTALSLAIGSAALLKAGSGDRVFPALFADSLLARDAGLGACVAAHYWPGEDSDCTVAALADADLVVAAGDDATIEALRARTRARFIGHGNRVSFAVVAREVAGDSDARSRAALALAEDIAIWDQRGCLSPQLCFVEGTVDDATRFGALVAAALRPLAERLPPAQPTRAERMALRRFRDDAEWRAHNGEAVTLFEVGGDGEGVVVAEPTPAFQPTPLCRSVRVQPMTNIDAFAALLAPARSALECAGVAAPAPRWPLLTEVLSAGGVHRVCALGEMQHPPLAWRQGGRPRVGDWTL